MPATFQSNSTRGGRFITTAIKGGLIGIANIIPGVSGGTFALILGVFDRMIEALNALGPTTLSVLWTSLRGGLRRPARHALAAEWRRVDARFMVVLCAGALSTILASSFLIDFLLRAHYSPTLAFFVGLILPSVAIPWGMMERRGFVLLWAIPGGLLTLGVTLVIPDSVSGSDNLLVAMGSGAIAISAMILPGLSGSYVLLVMGQYQNVLTKLTGLQRGLAEGRLDLPALTWLLALALGLIVGIVLFARLLHYLLAHFRSATMAFLIGLLLGSLWVLWPFKEMAAGAKIAGRDGEVKQEILIATAPNRLPRKPQEALIAAAALAAGLVGSGGLIALGRHSTNPHRNS